MSSELSRNFTSLYSCLQLLPSHSSSRSLLPAISICAILHPLIEVFRLILWLCINLQCVIENVLTCLNADKSLPNSFEGINVHHILNSSTILRDLGQEPAVRNSEWNRNSLVAEIQRTYFSRVFNSLVAKFIWFRLKNSKIF
ncbi:unnamed protein product [Moneuplotes crassus]|uniref:Uncharacterized protein n=1 Tax=Euplotes crassus TaxID=5936 RepID=A0AAD1XW91_EUPCR|nr:unnamed protein product [Moneuplotes crassus]